MTKPVVRISDKTDEDYAERIAQVKAWIANPMVSNVSPPIELEFFSTDGFDKRSFREEEPKREKFTDGLTDLVGY